MSEQTRQHLMLEINKVDSLTDPARMADAILAAGYRKPRIARTAKDLGEMPRGSVIRTSGSEIEEPWIAVADVDGFWDVANEGGLVTETCELDFPITILYEPES